jgi:tRNA threonylcarbamoyladenosine biosynthesis protein TsaB
MPSLSQILNTHAPLLVLDASSERVQAGVIRRDQSSTWASERGDAGEALFTCLERLGTGIDLVGAFAFCEGPGSILGIRSSTMAIRAWKAIRERPSYGYLSLALAAAANEGGLSLIADARRGLWHRLRKGGPLERLPASELSGPLATLEGFRHWDPLPAGTAVLPYSVDALLRRPEIAAADLFREAPLPDAYLHQEPSYVKWIPQIHRAP